MAGVMKARPVHLLSAVEVASAKCPADREHVLLNDGGGLKLRVYSSGRKVWLFRYGQRWATIGDASVVPLVEARKLAASRRPARRGEPNPIEVEREAARARAEAERLERAHAEAHRRAQRTAGELFDSFLTTYGGSRWSDKTQREVRALWTLHGSTIAGLPAGEVRREHLAVATDTLMTAGKLDAANRLHKFVRQGFAWMAERGLIAADPFTGKMRKPAPTAAPKERALSFHELRELLHDRLPVCAMNPYLKAAVNLTLATAMRPGEMLGARWEWIDAKARTLTLPETKNGRSHTVPLSTFAWGVIEALETVRIGPFMFPQTGRIATPADGAPRPDAPIRTDTFVTALSERQRPDGKPYKGRPAKEANALALPGGQWRAHDLRRTAASRLRELGCEPHAIESILNHVPPKLVRTYQVHDDLPERRRWLELLGEALAECERGEPVAIKVERLALPASH